jgi:hypothetical protein
VLSIRKAATWPPFFIAQTFDVRFLDATVDPLSTTVVAAICLRTAPVESPIDLIAFAIEPVRQTITTCSLGPVRLPVESMIDAIAFLIEAMFYAITAIVESIFDAIARVCKSCPADDQQRSA